MTGSKIQVYSIGQKLNSIGRQYKAKGGFYSCTLVMKWMKNEPSLVLRHSLACASRLSSDPSKLLLTLCFLRIWLQVLLHLKKKSLKREGRISVWRDRMISTTLFFPSKQMWSGRTLPSFPTEPIFQHLTAEFPPGFITAQMNSNVH